jgi:ribosomal protein S7
MAEQKAERLTERIMIRLTKSQAVRLNQEAFDRTQEEGGTISISMIIRKALKQARPDLFECGGNEKNGTN